MAGKKDGGKEETGKTSVAYVVGGVGVECGGIRKEEV